MKNLALNSLVKDTIMVKDGKTWFNLIAPTHDRPYDVVLQINLVPEEQEERCGQCVLMHEAFPKMVYSFMQDRKKKHEFMEREVFFAIMYIERDIPSVMDAFAATGYTTIPWLSVSPAPLIQKREKNIGAGNYFEKEHEWNILTDQNPSG